MHSLTTPHSSVGRIYLDNYIQLLRCGYMNQISMAWYTLCRNKNGHGERTVAVNRMVCARGISNWLVDPLYETFWSFATGLTCPTFALPCEI